MTHKTKLEKKTFLFIRTPPRPRKGLKRVLETLLHMAPFPLFCHNIWIWESVNTVTSSRELEIKRPTFSLRINNSCLSDETKDPSPSKERYNAPNLKKVIFFFFLFRNDILFTYFCQTLPCPRVSFVWIFLSWGSLYQLQLSKVSFFLYFTKSFQKKETLITTL